MITLDDIDVDRLQHLPDRVCLSCPPGQVLQACLEEARRLLLRDGGREPFTAVLPVEADIRGVDNSVELDPALARSSQLLDPGELLLVSDCGGKCVHATGGAW